MSIYGISLAKWRGARDEEALDPALMSMEAKPARSKKDGCAGCTFDRQKAEVCTRANERAEVLGLPLCDAGFIYEAVVRLQRDIFNTKAE